MTKELIEKLVLDFIQKVKNSAKNISIENLDAILLEIDKNPSEFFYDDVKIIYKIFKEELELKRSKKSLPSPSRKTLIK